MHQIPSKPKADELWEWVRKHSSYIPEATQKYLSEIANQSINKDLFEQTCIRKSKRSREKKNSILSSKLNKVMEAKLEKDVKTEKGAKVKVEDIGVKDRLIQAGVYIDDDNELLMELVRAQDEIRDLANTNRQNAQLLLKVAKTHDKLIKNREKLHELDKDMSKMITENKFNNEEFHIKLKQRQKYVKTIDKLQASNRALSNSNANLQ